MSSKAHGKTYEKTNRKYGKQQDSDTNSTSSQKSSPLRSSLSDDYSLIAAEVARLINPVIEFTIDKAVDKLQIKISSILEKLSIQDKRLREIEDAEFSKSCQSLANLHINFALMYPAKLKIFLPSGARVFSDPEEAHSFTSHLEKNNSGNPASVTTSISKFGSPPKDQRWKRYDVSRQSRLSTDLKSSQVQTKSRSRSRSPLPPRAGSLPLSSEDDMIPDT
ncbi:hypothetical protein XELAEV_18035042mg [Xenopus laevis]|uniref:Uncharacterized protein n=1 Tax=Xenopus laevis TaxID=8355 RepID=A0A974HBQ6_XENLA|nr:hypothetical protein XELAEV_18035042mg [Xenopus laevis]